MSRTIPIYHGRSKTFYADTCRSLVAAADAHTVQLEALARGHYPGRRLPKHALFGVKTVGFWDAPLNQPWGLDWHRNEGIEFTFLERGRVKLRDRQSRAFTEVERPDFHLSLAGPPGRQSQHRGLSPPLADDRRGSAPPQSILEMAVLAHAQCDRGSRIDVRSPPCGAAGMAGIRGRSALFPVHRASCRDGSQRKQHHKAGAQNQRSSGCAVGSLSQPEAEP